MLDKINNLTSEQKQEIIDSVPVIQSDHKNSDLSPFLIYDLKGDVTVQFTFYGYVSKNKDVELQSCLVYETPEKRKSNK